MRRTATTRHERFANTRKRPIGADAGTVTPGSPRAPASAGHNTSISRTNFVRRLCRTGIGGAPTSLRRTTNAMPFASVDHAQVSVIWGRPQSDARARRVVPARRLPPCVRPLGLVVGGVARLDDSPRTSRSARALPAMTLSNALRVAGSTAVVSHAMVHPPDWSLTISSCFGAMLITLSRRPDRSLAHPIAAGSCR
jgi:hypothetical protein